MPTPLQMCMRARLRTGDPATRPVRHSDTPVERGGQLQRDMRSAKSLSRKKPRHRTTSLSRANTACDGDACRPKPGKSPTSRPCVGIFKRCDDARDAGLDQQVATRLPTRRLVRARLERNVGGSPPRFNASLGQRHRLGMRSSTRLSPAAPDHPAVAHDHAPDIGIGRGPAARPLGKRQRNTHPARIGLRQIPIALSLSSSRLNEARCASSRAFCSASALALTGASIFCCATICASVRSAGHCST